MTHEITITGCELEPGLLRLDGKCSCSAWVEHYFRSWGIEDWNGNKSVQFQHVASCAYNGPLAEAGLGLCPGVSATSGYVWEVSHAA